MTRTDTQKEIVKRHLTDRGSITQLEATTRYLITCLAERIRDLRRDGLLITDVWEDNADLGRHKRYMLAQ